MQRLDSKQVYANAWMSVREDAVGYPDGASGIYSVVDCPDIALTIPLEGDRLHLVEQYRYPVGGRCWEFPSGSHVEQDLDPARAAARELREETGLVAGTMTLLGKLDVSPSTLSHRCWVFLATDLVHGTPQRDPEEQDMHSGWFARAEVERMIGNGTISDAKSTAAYALFLLSRRESRG